MAEERTTTETRSLGELLRELRAEGTTLMKQEVELAKTETQETVQTYMRNAASVAVGGAILYAGIILLLFAASAGLATLLVDNGMAVETAELLSRLIVGGVVALIGAIALKMGMSKIKHTSPVPKKTLETLKEDKQWA
ncbi:MAG: phage holin family protein [Sumerlaeia bacterium]